jgi:DNA-binding CsgD family transcriptional regulator
VTGPQHRYRSAARGRSLHPCGLTAREIAVIKAIAKHGTNRRVADALGITEETVKSHVQHILARLNAVNRTHAVAILWRLGLVTASDLDG